MTMTTEQEVEAYGLTWSDFQAIHGNLYWSSPALMLVLAASIMSTIQDYVENGGKDSARISQWTNQAKRVLRDAADQQLVYEDAVEKNTVTGTALLAKTRLALWDITSVYTSEHRVAGTPYNTPAQEAARTILAQAGYEVQSL